jgi:hypothetical protein
MVIAASVIIFGAFIGRWIDKTETLTGQSSLIGLLVSDLDFTLYKALLAELLRIL